MTSRRNIRFVLGAIVLAALIACLAIGSALAATANTVVTTEDELRAAAGQGSTAGNIKLANDITLSKTLKLDECPASGDSDHKVTIDLAGHNLRPSSSGDSVIFVPSGYELTVRDTTGKNAGSITGGAHGVYNQGTFNLTTGGIRNNGGAVDGCGLYNDTGAVATMTGGVIENNAASGEHDGAGIFNKGQVQVSKGVIQNNTTDASKGRGGGIYNGKKGNLTLSGGTIKNNSAWRGGAVYNKPDCDVMVVMGRAKIQNNTAAANGGGIYNGEKGPDGTKLAIVGGDISNNTAGATGGGVDNYGTMAASGGAITNNTAGGDGGGIYFGGGAILLSGNPVVKDNVGGGVANNLYLVKDKYTTVEAAFARGAKVGITCEKPRQFFTSGFESKNPDKGENDFFFPDKPGEPFDPYLEKKDAELRCIARIHYIDEYGAQQNCDDYEDVKSKEWGDWGQKKWYAVRKDTNLGDDVKVEGDVHLILCAGRTLKTEGIGIRRQDNGDKTRANFKIYNSVGDEGHLIADASDGGSAGIGYKKNSGGVGRLYIYGGHIKASGGGDAAGIGGVENRGNGPITIQGGRVQAYGGKWGAGIGGGQGGDQDNYIHIYGGKVEAYGGKYAAGIGGGDSDHGGADGGTIRIRNATVYALGGSRGAGIGGGEDGKGGTVTIENSIVEAHGGGKGAGIGGGQDSDYGGTLTVESGTVKAYGGFEAAGIGGGQDSCGGDFIANGGTIFAQSGEGCATGIGAGHGDYHEGTKKLYPTAKVTAYHGYKEPPDNVRPADQRLEGLTWQSVLIQPCDHVGGRDKPYDLDPDKHVRNGTCIFCGDQKEGVEESHVFNESHTCECGHVQDSITLVNQTGSSTQYASRGSTCTIERPGADTADKIFDGWTVQGLKEVADGTLLVPGEDGKLTFTVKPKGDTETTSQTITLTEQWYLPAQHQHLMTHHDAVAPTCTEPGNIEYWVCNQGKHPCGKFFSDASGTTEIAEDKTVLDPLGHNWSAPEYEWSSDHSSCRARRVCSHNGVEVHEEREKAYSKVTSSEPSPTPEGTIVYTFTYTAEFQNEAFTTQTWTETCVSPHGHQWSPTYTWSDDYSSCTAERVCAICGYVDDSETVNSTGVSIDPTCTTSGGTVYMAKFENAAFTTQAKGVTEAALGHDWGPWGITKPANETEAGEQTRTCARCNATETRSYTLNHEHNLTHVEAKQATCTSPGNIEYWKCESCERLFKDESASKEIGTENVAIAATGHAWREPTYVWSQDNTSCVAVRQCENFVFHLDVAGGTTTSKVILEPTCTVPGLALYTASFDNEVFSKQYKIGKIDPVGHNWGDWEQTKAPTCTDSGEETRTCLTCSATETREVAPIGHTWGRWQLVRKATANEEGLEKRVCENDPSHVEERAIPKTTHVHGLTKVAAKLPTCTEAGNSEYWVCTEGDNPCGRLFSDAAGTKGLAEDEVTVAPLGHSWGEVVYEWSEDNTTCTAKRVCLRDASHEVSETVETTVLTERAASCTKGGRLKYTAKFNNADFGSQIKIVQTGALGHTPPSTPTIKIVKYPTCTEFGSYDSVAYCTVCGEEIEGSRSHEKLAPYGHNWNSVSSATCTKAGTVTYTCTACNTTIEAYVPALGHDWGPWEITKPATDTEAGEETRTCSRCSATEQRPIPLPTHVHKEELLDHYPATNPADCSETDPGPGHVEYWWCKICHRFFIRLGQEETGSADIELDDETKLKEVSSDDIVIPFVHEWDEGVVTIEPTCTTEGIRTHTCARCGVTMTETLEATGHVPGEVSHTVFIKPSCVTSGFAWDVQKCKTCGQELSHQLAVVEPVGHDWEDWVVVHEATETEEGEITRRCKTVAEHVETVITPTAGHTWGEPSYVWSPDYSTCTATHVCTRCGASESEEMQAISAITKDATCEEKGEITYTAVFKNATFGVKTETLPGIAALGHEWGEWAVTREATGDSDGEESRTCSRCGKTETRAIPIWFSYRAVEGSGATWTKGSGEVLPFTFKRTVDDEMTFGHFIGVEVDGKAVSEKDESGQANYAAKSGSLVLSLQPVYLESLDEGDHTVKALFDDGSSEASFKVAAKAAPASDGSDEPGGSDGSDGSGGSDADTKGTAAKTGDTLPLPAVISTMLLSAVALAVSRKKMRSAR